MVIALVVVAAAEIFGDEGRRLSPEFTFDDGLSPVSVRNWELVPIGTDQELVLLRLGPPAVQGDPRPIEERKGQKARNCWGYSNETAKTEILVLCFENGKLATRERL